MISSSFVNKICTLAIAALGLSSVPAFSQLAANTYQFSALSGTFTDISGGTTISAIQVDDGTSGPVPIGFTFNYCGIDYTQLVVGSNGVMTFNSSTSYLTLSNTSSYLDDIQPALLPLWDDLSGAASTASATYLTTGTAPNRVFTLECKDWRWGYSSAYDPTISFEVKLYETSNIVEFVYRQEAGPGSTSKSATIGIVDGNSPPGYLVLDNTGSNPTVSSTNFDNYTSLATRPATGQIYRFTPVPALDMDADSVFIAANSCSNDSSLISIEATNLGTATIDTVRVHWEVDGVLQPPVIYSASAIPNFFSSNNKVTIPLGKVFFSDMTPKSVKAWTYHPNNLPDMVPANDTTTMSVSPVYQGISVDISPGNTSICVGSPLVLDAGQQPAGCIFIWSNGAVTQSTSVNHGGDYSVIVQSLQGCFAYDTVSVSETPTLRPGVFGAVDNGGRNFTFTAVGDQNVTNYFWDFGDGDVQNSSSNTAAHHYNSDGTYAVVLKEGNSCDTAVLSHQIYVSVTPSGIHSVSGGWEADLKVYPNPANSSVTMSTESLSMNKIVVYNVLGQKVYEGVPKNSHHVQLDLYDIPSGLYNMSVYTDRGIVIRKLDIIK